MRYSQLFEKSLPPSIRGLTDQERLDWLKFLYEWLVGKYMQKVTPEHVARWEEFAKLFPTGVSQPTRLYRVMTVPKDYASLKGKTFEIERPAPGAVGSWTSTKVGMDCVAGVAIELFSNDHGLIDRTARIGIEAVIEPHNILATAKTMKLAFLSLSHDFEYEEINYKEPHPKYGTVSKTTHPAYLGHKDDVFYSELSYLRALFQDIPGGPYRQSEHIVHTTPVQAKLVYIYRIGDTEGRYGNEDPHNY